jgi:2,4-dienoyl-CoA reductase-like NADH-dependent reductase (Old Yellow Enzyme family)
LPTIEIPKKDVAMKLFEPYVIGTKLTLVNRIMVLAIVTRLATVEGNVTDALIERYLLYARGGAGRLRKQFDRS